MCTTWSGQNTQPVREARGLGETRRKQRGYIYTVAEFQGVGPGRTEEVGGQPETPGGAIQQSGTAAMARFHNMQSGRPDMALWPNMQL